MSMGKRFRDSISDGFGISVGQALFRAMVIVVVIGGVLVVFNLDYIKPHIKPHRDVIASILSQIIEGIFSNGQLEPLVEPTKNQREAGEAEVDVAREAEVDVAGEAEVDVAREAEVDVAREAEVDVAREAEAAKYAELLRLAPTKTEREAEEAEEARVADLLKRAKSGEMFLDQSRFAELSEERNAATNKIQQEAKEAIAAEIARANEALKAAKEAADNIQRETIEATETERAKGNNMSETLAAIDKIHQEAKEATDAEFARSGKVLESTTAAIDKIHQEAKEATDAEFAKMNKKTKDEITARSKFYRSLPAYARNDWQHWIDEDGDCLSTRDEVLAAQSLRRVDIDWCHVVSGEWIDPYTGTSSEAPWDLDIDHLVPLWEVHASGGSRWDSEKKKRYANDLDLPEALIAVSAEVNWDKGAKDPAHWMPPDEEYHCEYINAWVKVKEKWELGMDEEEEKKIEEVRSGCPSDDPEN